MIGVRAIDHVGYVVDDLDAAIALHRSRFGMRLELRETMADQDVEAAMLRAGDARVELIRPTDPEGPIAAFLAKRGPGVHHVAYAVDDLEAALAALREGGAELIDATPRRGLGGHMVAFVHPRSCAGVLTELVAAGEHSL